MTKKEKIENYRKEASDSKKEAEYLRSIGDTGDAGEHDMRADEANYQADRLEGKVK